VDDNSKEINNLKKEISEGPSDCPPIVKNEKDNKKDYSYLKPATTEQMREVQKKPNARRMYKDAVRQRNIIQIYWSLLELSASELWAYKTENKFKPKDILDILEKIKDYEEKYGHRDTVQSKQQDKELKDLEAFFGNPTQQPKKKKRGRPPKKLQGKQL